MKIQSNTYSIKRTAGRLAIAVAAAAVVCLGAQKLAGQSNSVAGELTIAARMPIPQHYVAYLTPLDRATLNGVEGSMNNTNGSLDLAINGKGFFRVEIPASMGGGIGYTRNGSLARNLNGDLCVRSGASYELSPPINIPSSATNIAIATDGTVQFQPKNAVTVCTAGQIQLTHFDHQRRLQPLGCEIYGETDGSGPAIISDAGDNGMGILMQGFLESDGIRESVASLK